jgi:hypothetical protein
VAKLRKDAFLEEGVCLVMAKVAMNSMMALMTLAAVVVVIGDEHNWT